MDPNTDINGRRTPDLRQAEPRPSEAGRQPERFRLYLLAALTAGLIGLCGFLAIPFLPAITWAVALAIIAWPLHRWISRRLDRPVAASLLSCAAVVLIILVPGIFVSYQLASEANAIAIRAEQNPIESSLQEKMHEVAGLHQIAVWMERLDLQLETEVRRMVKLYTQDAAGLATGSLGAVLQFLVVIFILYYLFLDRGKFLHELRDLLPLSRPESEQVFAGAADSVHASLYATTITSLIDATAGGLLFWALGLPSPLLWTVVMFVLSLLPVVGAAMVWVPAAAYLMLTDRWLGGFTLVGWGVASFILVGNILYVRLAGQRMRMHAVPAMIAFLGGIAVFGLSGVILGPAIVAVTMAVIGVWRQRMNSDQDLAAAEAVH